MDQYYFARWCLLSVVVCNGSGGQAGRPPGAWVVWRPTLHGGPVRLRPVMAIPCCNSLFTFSSQSTVHRLQRVQDAAARLLCGAPPRTHAPSLLKQPHWLPVSSRVQFKLCTLMDDIWHGTAPQYLVEVCERCDDSRLRSRERCNFAVKRTRLQLADKAFSVAGPRAWNALPTYVKQSPSRASFRKKLKTYLFKF